MKRFTIVLLAVFLAGCGHKPIYNVSDPVPPQAQKLSFEQIEMLIVEAGQLRGWKFDRAGAGHLIARQEQAKYSAVIDIYFDATAYRIVYQSSSGMQATNDGNIHEHYNFWIRNLEHDIDTRLANAPMTVR